VISTIPGTTAVTNPVDETLAIAGLEDFQIAWFVTSCIKPVFELAFARNCVISPANAR